MFQITGLSTACEGPATSVGLDLNSTLHSFCSILWLLAVYIFWPIASLVTLHLPHFNLICVFEFKETRNSLS